MSLWLALRGRVERARSEFSAAGGDLLAELEKVNAIEKLARQKFGTTNYPPMRTALDQLTRSGNDLQSCAQAYLRCADRCTAYLAAVDPDNAAGSIRGLPPPTNHGSPRGGHQSADGPPVEPPRQPVTDESRRRVHVYVELGPPGLAELTQRDDGIIATRLSWLNGGGHAGRRHGHQVTSTKLDARVREKIDPTTGTTTDWEKGKQHRCADHATSFTSGAALVFAEAVLWDSPKRKAAEIRADAEPAESPAHRQMSVRMPAKDVLGTDFRQHVRGRSADAAGTRDTTFSDNATITVVYRRESDHHQWQAHTCFPKP